MAVSICGNHSVYITHNHCDECEALSKRLDEIEELLEGKTNVVISITDADGEETIATVLAHIDGGVRASNLIGYAEIGTGYVS